jgi:phosphopantetheine adenylyltransferase
MNNVESIFLFVSSCLTIISSSALLTIYLMKKELRTLCFKLLIMMSVGNILYSLIWVICIILY